MNNQAVSTSQPGAASSPRTRALPSNHSLTRAAGMSLALLVAQPAGAWVVDTSSTANIGGSKPYAGVFKGLTLPIIDIAPSIGFDVGLVSGGASGHADIDARFEVGAASSLNLASKAQARTFMFTQAPQPTVGDSFYLINQIDSLGIQKLNIQANNFSANAGLLADLGGSAWGKACAGFCVNASLKLKINGGLPLAGIDQYGLTVFGKAVDNSAPFKYDWPGGLGGASASLPTFSKTFTNIAPGQGAIMVPKAESALYANLDLAALVAKAAGFPIPLKGDLLGFGYELLSLNAFAGLDVEHAFTLQPPVLRTIYDFSSPVQFFDANAGVWSAPVTSLKMGDNEAIELRSQNATSIGVTSFYQMEYKVDYDYNLLLKTGIDLSALELHGLGLSLGPLIDPAPWNIPLGKFDIDSGSTTGKMTTKGGTSVLKFDPLKLMFPPDSTVGELVDLCLLVAGGCDKTGYVTERADIGDFIQETTYRVFNFGDVDCDGLFVSGCVFDPDFVPLVTQIGASRVAPPPSRTEDLLALLASLGLRNLPYVGGSSAAGEYAGDFEEILAFLNDAPLIERAASSPELMLAALRDIGLDPDDPFPPRQRFVGDPAGSQSADGEWALDLRLVAEPSMLSLLSIAALAVAATRRRRAAAHRHGVSREWHRSSGHTRQSASGRCP